MSSVAAPVSTAPRRLLPLWLRLVVLSIAAVAGYYLLLLLVVEGGSATATQQVFNALTLGSIYALVALGYRWAKNSCSRTTAASASTPPLTTV